MTSQYRMRTAEQAWVGLSEPAPFWIVPGISVVEGDVHYQVSVPLGVLYPRDVCVDLNSGLLTVSVKPYGAPSEDLDDLYCTERTMPAIYNIYLGGDADEGTLSALCLRDTLLISIKRHRTGI